MWGDDFNYIINISAIKMETSSIVEYCQNISSKFHQYFTLNKNNNPIFSKNKIITTARLSLIKAVQITLKKCFKLISISIKIK